MVALLMLAYVIGLWLGKAVREALFPGDNRKHELYSGLFVLLILKLRIPLQDYTRFPFKHWLPSFSLFAMSELMSEYQEQLALRGWPW
jgi:hypothetical protein